MQTQKNATQNTALIKKPKAIVAKTESIVSPVEKKNLLIRNLTFETDSFFYMINNDQEANFSILPMSSQDGFELDKIQTQNLIKDLNELIAYL